MCHVNEFEEEMRDWWDKHFLSVLCQVDGLENRQYYSKLQNMLQYYLILQKNLHSDITVQDKFQLFHSLSSGDVELQF